MIFYVSIAKVNQLPVGGVKNEYKWVFNLHDFLCIDCEGYSTACGGGKNTSICKIIYAPIELFARGDTKISDI